MNRLSTRCAVIALFLFGSSHFAHAQYLEEVLVTAQKRTQDLQNVPISVAVVSGDDLAAQNKTRIADIAKLVPGFTFSSGTSDAGQSILVRGVGTQSFSRSVDQSVGTVIDGVSSASLSGSLLDFSDVEQVEVLRGPQGMLFGKNASAGLLNITTGRPTDDLSLGATVRYGSENLLNLNGYIAGPIIQNKLLGRIYLYSNTQDAMLENDFAGGKDANDRDEWGGKAKLKWLLSDDLDAMLSYTHNERDHNCCVTALRIVEPGSIADREGGPVGENVDKILDNDASVGSTELDVYSLELNYSFAEYLFTSISAYTEENVFGSARADLYTRTALPINNSNADYQQFTQEFRITSPADGTLSFVAGLYYFDKEIDREFDRLIDLYGIDFAPAPNSGALSVINDSYTENESFAVFGQLTWNISFSARISVGARYNNDQLFIDQTVGSFEGTLPEAPPGTIVAHTNDQAVSWRIIGELDVANDAMVYASIARGYKGPGSNSLPSGPTSRDVFVDPEIPTNYEVGIKSQWLDNRVRFNAAVYYTEFEDFQASAQVPDAFPPIFFLTNAGELETQGVEMELDAQVTQNLTLSSSIAYTDATFSKWKDAPCYSGQTAEQGCIDGSQDLSGGEMPDSPDWAFNASANYIIPFASQPFSGFARGNYFWRDDVQFSTTNNPMHTGDDYGTFDLNLGLAADDGRYTVQFYVLNVFDNFYESVIGGQSVVGITASHGLSYEYQRRYGMSLQLAL